jgi:hypothetical protein
MAATTGCPLKKEPIKGQFHIPSGSPRQDKRAPTFPICLIRHSRKRKIFFIYIYHHRLILLREEEQRRNEWKKKEINKEKEMKHG